MSAAAALPTSYKSLAHYVKIGGEHRERDIAIYYWCSFID